MRLHEHFLRCETLLQARQHGKSDTQKNPTPRHLGLTLPGEWQRSISPLATKSADNGASKMWTGIIAETSPQTPLTALATKNLIAALRAAEEPLLLLHRDPNTLRGHNAVTTVTTIATIAGEVNPNTLKIIRADYDDVWLRDTGPIFLRSHSRLGDAPCGGVVLFRFNGWGEKYPHKRDAELAAHLIHALHAQDAFAGMEDFHIFHTDLICEGGALESNGHGTLITTDSVMLNPNRSPNRSPHQNEAWTRAEMTVLLQEIFGMDDIIFLPGGLVDDDTDGHVDNVCRFVSRDTVFAASISSPPSSQTSGNSSKENILRDTLTQNENILRTRFHVIPVALPSPRFDNGRRLPESPLNYIHTQHAIIYPRYADPVAEQAWRGLLAESFPSQRLIGVDWHEAIREGGGPHCMTNTFPYL